MYLRLIHIKRICYQYLIHLFVYIAPNCRKKYIVLGVNNQVVVKLVIIENSNCTNKKRVGRVWDGDIVF